MSVTDSIRLWLLAGLLCLSAAGAAAPTTNAAWSMRVWQSDDGLPNNIVTGLAQTPDGFLWVANPTRLTRFDGVQFEDFPAGIFTGGLNQRITTLATGRDGALWAASDRGVVACLKSGAVRVYTNNLPASFVESMVEDGEGALWIKDRGGDNICRIANGQVTQLPMAGSYRAITTDIRGRLWFISNGQVGLYRNGRFETLDQLGKSGYARITTARAGGVWICLKSELFHYEEGKPPVSYGSFQAQSAGTEPVVMLEDRAGAVWIGTSDSGLIRYQDGNFEVVPVSHSQILSLVEDREGNLWAGTGGGGLERVQPRVVELEGADSGLPFPAVQSLCQDLNGNVWAATQNGLLICRSNGVWSTVSTGTNWPGGRAACVTVDRSGGVWIAIRRQRLFCLRDGKYEIWQAANGLVGRNFEALLAASNGDLWIAGSGPDGLQRLRNGRLESFKLTPDEPIIHGLAEDAAGNIWFGTSKGTLLRLHGGTVTDETTNTSGGPVSIRTLLATPDGSLWIGYAGGGLGWINPAGRYLRVTSSQGLFDNHISEIVADDHGWLWLGSDHGIFKVRQNELADLAAKKISRVISVHYGPGEGLSGLQANFGESPSVLHDRDGRLWLPMRTALAVINPDSSPDDSVPPLVLLKQVIVDDQLAAQYAGIGPAEKNRDIRTTLRLPPDHRHLEFIFTALSFKAPENIRFQYQLQGFDNGWVDAGTERRASYSRLAAGTYLFVVRACNSDGVWGDAAAGLQFVVTPFFWQTWWFWCFALVFFTSVVVAVVRFVSRRQLLVKMRALERQAELDRERTRIARDIHDDIGNLLTQATLLGGLMLRDRAEPEKTVEHARQISSTIEQVTSSLDEIVWAVNPRNDTLPQLIDYIGQFAVEFLSPAGIACRVDLPDHPPHRAVSSDVRHNLFLVVKEALNNVARHSAARTVSLAVTVAEQNLEVTIQDDGKSFDPSTVNGSSNGLRNMRQRMDELGGRFTVDSRPGAGTRIWLSVPAGQRNGS